MSQFEIGIILIHIWLPDLTGGRPGDQRYLCNWGHKFQTLTTLLATNATIKHLFIFTTALHSDYWHTDLTNSTGIRLLRQVTGKALRSAQRNRENILADRINHI